MGLTLQSTQIGAIDKKDAKQLQFGSNTIALAGNPNVGKSTVFNALTGLNQHTGNWPGKTVASAIGSFKYNNSNFTLVDLPGTYSLFSHSKEEEITKEFICSAKAKTIVVVADATCLERNLNLVLQILEITHNCILCVNLMDQAKKKKIQINIKKLKEILGIEVVAITAKSKKDIEKLKLAIAKCSSNSDSVYKVTYDKAIEESIENINNFLSELNFKSYLPKKYIAINLLCNQNHFQNLPDEVAEIIEDEKCKLAKFGISKQNIEDKIACSLVLEAEKIGKECIFQKYDEKTDKDLKIDKIVTSKFTGIPIMLLLLGAVIYISIIGANYPSQFLAAVFERIKPFFNDALLYINTPVVLQKLLIEGVYETLAKVVSVMLPPMAIFFPLFTILEDFGYLPRVAFNLDGVFKKCCAHGKQCLTMCMGLGCNAAGVTGTRIIDSPRERLIAILTNNLVPCNGRFPVLITVSTIFATVYLTNINTALFSSAVVLTMIILGILSTFGVSYLLSKTFLKGTPSQFSLELPPYRKPKFTEVIYRSMFDRTLFVLARAVSVAAPAGAVLWLMTNINIGNNSIFYHLATFFDPIGKAIGLDGFVLIAFILGIPANEIVFPILLMGYTASGSFSESFSLQQIGNLLVANGWTMLTMINFMILTLFHFPCATTLLTIQNETKNFKWTILAFSIPTILGIALCALTTFIAKILM